ncbi:MAG: YcxB family protein [Bacteroidetes bacterium]|nr:YcxB family protein [Bacteroidota bacterium]
MRIAFAYDKRQVMQALRYHFISRLEIRLLIIAVNVFAVGSVVLYALGKVTPFAFLLSSCLWLVLTIALWWFLPWVVYRQTKAFQFDFEMQFSKSGVELFREGRGNAWQWQSLHSWRETPFFFHLYFTAQSFWLVPKEALEDAQRLQLRNWLREKVER